MAEKKSLSAVEEAELSKEPLYRLGAKLLKNRKPVTVIATLFTAVMAYQALGMQMTTAFNDLLPYRHPFVQVHFKFATQFGGANNVNVMLKVEKGDVFSREVLKKIYDMTQAMDRVTGVNHDQIASIGHRTTRYLTVLGGTIATPPVMRRVMREQSRWLERALTFLATTGSTAPFIGLFGTVWGIMNAFQGLSTVQASSLQAVAPGIAEALIATAVGLAAAIPAVMAYNHFRRQVRLLAADMELFAAEFLNIARHHFL